MWEIELLEAVRKGGFRSDIQIIYSREFCEPSLRQGRSLFELKMKLLWLNLNFNAISRRIILRLNVVEIKS